MHRDLTPVASNTRIQTDVGSAAPGAEAATGARKKGPALIKKELEVPLK
jgi:hypothetical protein